MATFTATEIMEKAMIKATIIYPGETIPTTKKTQVFDELNNLLESWSLRGSILYAGIRETFNLTSGTSEYTFGSGGDFNSARPTHLLDESYVSEGDRDYKIVLREIDRYNLVPFKSNSGVPEIIAYSPEFPLGKVYISPAPNSGLTVTITSVKQLVSFPDQTTNVSLPPGYARAIIANLAIEISPNFGKKVPDELAAIAGSSLSAVLKANKKIPKKMRAEQLTRVLRGGTRTSIDSGPWG